MKRFQLFFSVLLVPLDAALLLLAFVAAYYLRDQFQILSPDDLNGLAGRLHYTGTSLVLSFSNYLHYVGIIIPAMMLIFALTGLYAMRSTSSWAERLLHIVIGVSVGEFFILLLFLLKKDFFLPRSTVLYSWVLGTLFVVGGRLLVQGIQQILYRYNMGRVKVAVVGKNKVAEGIITRLSRPRDAAYQMVHHFDQVESESVIATLKTQPVDELIIVSNHYTNNDLISLRNYCLEEGCSFSFVPPLLTELQSVFAVRSVGRLPMIEVRPTPLEGWGRVIKRAFDVVVGFFLLILFSPIFVILALALYLASPGPLFYKHRRIGKDRRIIDILKFRTLKWEFCTGPNGHPDGDKNFTRLLQDNPDLAAEWKQSFKLKNDPRLTSVGRFVRKTSLDELPQLFNVLGSTLSLVGPRPIVTDEIEKYGEKARLLFTVKPGMTGLWQVSGRNDISYDERIALDARYIEHWSLGTDIIILCKTAAVVLGKAGGAY